MLWALKRAFQAYSAWEAVIRPLYLQLDTVQTEPWLWTSLHSPLQVLFFGAFSERPETPISSSYHGWAAPTYWSCAGNLLASSFVCCSFARFAQVFSSWPLRVREWTLLTPMPSLVRFPVRAASWICFMFSWTSALVCCSRSAWPWNRKWRRYKNGTK